MRIYAAVSDGANVSDEFLPFGRLIPCELVITVDSSRIATPIVGLVTEDQWENGNLIIPAGTEVHGQCQLDRSRDRIASDRSWVIVWQESGKELPVQGVALDSSPRPDGSGWDITDGSAGLRGMTLKGDQYAEIKEIIAKAISAGAAGLRSDCHQHRPARQRFLDNNGLLANSARADGAGRWPGIRQPGAPEHQGRRRLYPRSRWQAVLPLRHPNNRPHASPPGVDPKSPQLKKLP